MKKVLIISYYWPPAGGPGSQRVVKFAKYLPQFGWQPVILTVKNGEFPYIDPSLEKDIPSDVKVYRTKSWEPFLFYKKLTGRPALEALPVGLLTHEKKNVVERLASWIRANLFIPDARIGWIPFATKKGLQIIDEEKIDLIFSSSPPHSLQLIAKKLKERTGLAWVADFRDPWTDIRYYESMRRSRWASRKDFSLETEILQEADAIITVSASVLEGFKENAGDVDQKRFFVLPNGYDESDFDSIVSQGSSKFLIVHTGNLLEHQNPTTLWLSLKNLIEKNIVPRDRIQIKFFGRVHEKILLAARDSGLDALISQTGFVEHSQIVQEMKDAHILLMVVPNMRNNRGIVTGKLFEYIGSGRPILIIGPPDSDAGKIISDFDNSIICDYADEKRCMEFISRVFSYWMDNHRVPESPPDLRAPYSRKHIARSLSEIFNLRVS